MSELDGTQPSLESSFGLSYVSTALGRLIRTLQAGAQEPRELYHELVGLQAAGISRADLRVHVERVRAANDADDSPDDAVEDACILALDIVEGVAGELSLDWTSAQTAQVYLARVLSYELLQRAARYAFEPNDLLPPRPTGVLAAEVADQFATRLASSLRERSYHPRRADVFRVPKARMTTRPAALLAPTDRVVWEGLAERLVPKLQEVLPGQVLWPRGRSVGPAEAAAAHGRYSDCPRSWSARYVVVADVESFYESVSHAALAAAAQDLFGEGPGYGRALRMFLEAITGASWGIPQGPLASDVFATALLARVDRELSQGGRTYVRYADDFLLAANSIAEARRSIEHLESALAAVGLRLSASKTRVMRRETYVQNLDREASPRVERLRVEQRNALELALLESEDEETVAEILGRLGVDNEALWGIFYHGSISIEDVLADRRDQLLPPLIEGYAAYFVELVGALKSDSRGEELTSMEREFRECLIFLAAGKRLVELSDVSLVVRWFPRLADQAARYFSALSDIAPQRIARELRQWLDNENESDWVSAWMTYAVDSGSSAVRPLVRTSLSDAAMSPRPLTRIGALWALIRVGEVDFNSAESLLAGVSPALLAEIYLGWLAGGGSDFSAQIAP